MFATFYRPEADIFGPASIFAILVSIALWLVAESKGFRPIQSRILLLSIIGFLLFLFISGANVGLLSYIGIWKHRRFPDLSDYIGNHIIMSFGLLFAWQRLRLEQGNRYVSAFFLLLFFLLIVSEIIFMTQIL